MSGRMLRRARAGLDRTLMHSAATELLAPAGARDAFIGATPSRG